MVFSFIFLFLFEAKKATTELCSCIFFFSVICCKQGDNNKLTAVPKFSPPTSFLPTYLTSFCVHSIVRARKSLKCESKRRREGKTRNQKWEGRSGNQEKMLKIEGQKREPKVKGQNGSLKVSSLPSLGFFFGCCFLVCFVFSVVLQ